MNVKRIANLMMGAAALGLGAYLARTMAERDAASDTRRLAAGPSTGAGGPASAVLAGSDGALAASVPTTVA